jgi:pimeloyl-ACP methyl ester carboxylesterase
VTTAIDTPILLPGLDGTGDLFEPFVNAAPQNVQPVVVRYPVNEVSMDALEMVARSKLVDRCIVIAESFSGPIGVRIAGDPRVRALILCNSFVTSPFVVPIPQLAFATLFSIPLPHFVLRSLLLERRASPSLIEGTLRAIRRVPTKVLASRAQEVSRINEQTALRALGKPVLYLRGSQDFLISRKCLRVIETMRPDASIVNIDGPHLLLQTSPRECWDAIVRFLEQHHVVSR